MSFLRKRKPKVRTDNDEKRALAEQVVRQKESIYRQRAMESLEDLQAMAANMDLENNPHLARLMVKAAYGVKYSTDVLTDMTRDEIWTLLDLHDDEVDEQDQISEIDELVHPFELIIETHSEYKEHKS